MTHSVWHHKRISSAGDIGGAEGLSISSGECGSSSSAGADGIGDDDDASSESNNLQKICNHIKILVKSIWKCRSALR